MSPKPYYGPDPFDQPKIIQAALVPEMTLRDYFAGQAMIALMSSPSWVSGMDEAAATANCDFKSAVAVNAFRLADAMMKARTEPSTV